MRIKLIALFILLGAVVSATAQNTTSVSWSTLMDLKFKDVYMESTGGYVYIPLFNEKHKPLDGREIEITGYIIPIDVESDTYVLSAFPFSACFFCGGAGPESVMAIYFQSPPRRLKTDERLTLTGVFELNDSDVDELIYVLKDVRIK